MSEYGIETPDISSHKEVQITASSWKSNIYTVLNGDHYQERGVTINSSHYSEMPNQLKLTVQSKCREKQ
jgi:hypothetical protein